MYPGGGASNPEKWQTQEILKWIRENDDSKEEIRSRVMGVVQANDLDGHTLKQLAAEKDEIQNLFPALKERLAFKSMLRNLFKEESQVLASVDPTNAPKQSSPVPVVTYPQRLQPVSSFPSPDFTTSARFQNTSITNKLNPIRDRSMQSVHTELHAVDITMPHQRILEKQPGNTNFILPQKMRDLINVNSLPLTSNPFGTKQTIRTVTPMSICAQPVYFNHSMASPQAPKRQAIQNETSSSVTQIVTPSVTQAVTSMQLVAAPVNVTQSSPRITSVTSYCLAAADEKTVESISRYVTGSSSSSSSSSKHSPSRSYRKHNSSAGFYRYIDYPAPVPEFSEDLMEWVNSKDGLRPSVRKRIMRDCAQFYVSISMGQRLNSNDYANIGRTMIEKYPVLSCSGAIPWALFNKNLSQCIRNLRRRLKKMEGTGLTAVTFDPINEISDDENEVEEVTCIEVEEGDDEQQDVFFIKEELPAWTSDQDGQYIDKACQSRSQPGRTDQ